MLKVVLAKLESLTPILPFKKEIISLFRTHQNCMEFKSPFYQRKYGALSRERELAMQQTHKHDKQINQPTQVHILWICNYHPFMGGNWDPRIRSKGNVRRGKATIEATLSLPELYSYVSLLKAYCNTWGCWSLKRKTCFSLQSSHLAFNYVWLSCFRFTAIFVKQKWWVPSVSIIVILSCHLCWWIEPHQ